MVFLDGVWHCIGNPPYSRCSFSEARSTSGRHPSPTADGCRGGIGATRGDSPARRYSDPRASSASRHSAGVRRRKNTATAATKHGKIRANQSSRADVVVASEGPRLVRAAAAVPVRGAFAAHNRQWSDRHARRFSKWQCYQRVRVEKYWEPNIR